MLVGLMNWLLTLSVRCRGCEESLRESCWYTVSQGIWHGVVGGERCQLRGDEVPAEQTELERRGEGGCHAHCSLWFGQRGRMPTHTSSALQVSSV